MNKQFNTPKFDSRFDKIPHLAWYPWVGKNYHKTKILVVGAGTDKWHEEGLVYDGKGLTIEIINSIAIENNHPGTKGLNAFVKIFVEGLNIRGQNVSDGELMRQQVWSSVAFTNFLQFSSAEIGWHPRNSQDIEAGKAALHGVLDIIKPDLCLIWSAMMPWDGDLTEKEGYKWGARKKIGWGIPQVCRRGEVSFICIQHPSRISPPKWADFLMKENESKKVITNFLDYLNSLQ